MTIIQHAQPFEAPEIIRYDYGKDTVATVVSRTHIKPGALFPNILDWANGDRFPNMFELANGERLPK